MSETKTLSERLRAQYDEWAFPTDAQAPWMEPMMELATEAADALDTKDALLREAQVLAERLKFEAQMHAGEARAANATIYEIYQVLTGAKGEPGNWHGAEPARQFVAEVAGVLEGVVEAVRKKPELDRAKALLLKLTEATK